MATIKDIARVSGLSVATVSKFINGGNVLPENRRLLEQAIKAFDFRINQFARGLKTRCSMTVGVLIPRFNSAFFSTLVSEIENHLSREGYSGIICAYHDDQETEREKLDFLLGKAVDGIIMTPLGAASRCLPLLRAAKIPLVMVDRVCEGIGCDMVLSDNFNAAAGALRHLAERGHRRIGIVLGPEGVFTAAERLVGYKSAVCELGLENDEELICRGNYSVDSGNRCLLEFLDLARPPSAVIITNYEMTLGGVLALERRKIKVPDELSLIGFDNLELAQVIKPPLTMVVQPVARMAAAAVELLLARLNRQNLTADYTVRKFGAEIISRESVKNINFH